MISAEFDKIVILDIFKKVGVESICIWNTFKRTSRRALLVNFGVNYSQRGISSIIELQKHIGATVEPLPLGKITIFPAMLFPLAGCPSSSITPLSRLTNPKNVMGVSVIRAFPLT